jgi:hypothetical protein
MIVGYRLEILKRLIRYGKRFGEKEAALSDWIESANISVHMHWAKPHIFYKTHD